MHRQTSHVLQGSNKNHPWTHSQVCSVLQSFWFETLGAESHTQRGACITTAFGIGGRQRKIFSGNLLRCIKPLSHQFLLYPYTRKETELGYLGFQASGRNLNLRSLCNHEECCLQTQDLRNSHFAHQKQT